MKYTREDVIIWPDDKRIEIGKEYYYGTTPNHCLMMANNEGMLCGTLDTISTKTDSCCPFKIHNKYRPCIILKKESEKRIIPYNFSLEEDREAIKGKWFFDASCDFFDEVTPIGFNIDALGAGRVCVVRNNGSNAHIEWYDGEHFKRKFHHEDTGLPAGKEEK